jgi:hypothetical protein
MGTLISSWEVLEEASLKRFMELLAVAKAKVLTEGNI